MHHLENICAVTFILFAGVFCFYLENVNKQLAEFFRLVSDYYYPKKTITIILSLFFIIMANFYLKIILENKNIKYQTKFGLISEYLSYVI